MAQIANSIIGIVLFYLVLNWDVESDYKKWQKDQSVKHKREFWIRSVLLIPSLFFLSLPFPIDIFKVLISIGLEGFTYLLLFDGWYNLKREQNWWFLGTVDEDDAWWDKLQRKISLLSLKVLKIGIPVIFLILYIINI